MHNFIISRVSEGSRVTRAPHEGRLSSWRKGRKLREISGAAENGGVSGTWVINEQVEGVTGRYSVEDRGFSVEQGKVCSEGR